MAINVNEVYQTVLLILNKEQRGYLTPAEFNKIGTQVQLEIFEKYFDDLNQQLRVPENDSEYADRIKTIEDNIQIFNINNTLAYQGGVFVNNSGIDIHRLGSLQYEPGGTTPVEVQQMTQHEYLESQRSTITQPTDQFPVFVRRGDIFYVYPLTITGDVGAYYIAKPEPVEWGYQINTAGNGEYLHVPATSTDFTLSPVEQTEVILRILTYAGLVIRDPQIVQTAAQMVAADEANEKG